MGGEIKFDLQLFGGGSWSDKDWTSYSSARSYSSPKTTVDHIYTSRTVKDVINKGLDPKVVKLRESRDSEDNPLSTALIVALDVTGSMGRVLNVMARKGLPTLAEEIYNRKPITNPHIMCM